MIDWRGLINGIQTVDIRVRADVPWLDSFWYVDGTRPLLAGWARLRLIIRPAFDHVTLLRELRTDGVAPEITVDDADRAAFTINVAQSVMTTFLRKVDGTANTYAQMLIAEYAGADFDNVELWRGKFIVEPGILPT